MNKIGYETRKEVYRALLAKHGRDVQIMKAVEELGELVQALCKLGIGEGSLPQVAEEMADVTIMLEQLRIIFKADEVVDLHMDMKIRRAAEKLGLKIAGGE